MDPLTLITSVNRLRSAVVWKRFCGAGEDISAQIVAGRRRADRHGKNIEGVLELRKGKGKERKGQAQCGARDSLGGEACPGSSAALACHEGRRSPRRVRRGSGGAQLGAFYGRTACVARTQRVDDGLHLYLYLSLSSKAPQTSKYKGPASLYDPSQMRRGPRRRVSLEIAAARPTVSTVPTEKCGLLEDYLTAPSVIQRELVCSLAITLLDPTVSACGVSGASLDIQRGRELRLGSGTALLQRSRRAASTASTRPQHAGPQKGRVKDRVKAQQRSYRTGNDIAACQQLMAEQLVCFAPSRHDGARHQSTKSNA